ncbi:MAG: PilZ domain-containing protein [Phycisphaerae bacterium]
MQSTTPLDAESTGHALDEAMRSRAQVAIEAPAVPTPINGFLIAADPAALLVQLTGRPNFNPPDLARQDCEVRIHGAQHYLFPATIESVSTWGRSMAVAVKRPERMGVVERRRFRRRSLAQSSRVVVQWTTGDTRHQHTSALLNVSADGLACRMEEVVAGGIKRDASVSTSFTLPWNHQTFKLDALVTNKTPASKGSVILGLQFTQDARAAEPLALLRQLLKNPDAVIAEAETCA